MWVVTFVALCLVGARHAWAQSQHPGAGRGPAVSSDARERRPADRRLVLKLGGGQERWLLNRMGGRPYPEFLLQRWENGAWKVYPADDFTRGAGQVVISIAQPGTYRVVAAASPYELYESESVEMKAGDKQVMTTLRTISPAAACEVRLKSSRTGQPLAGMSLALSGPYASLPPVRAVTDAAGRLKLAKVRTPELHLELEHGGNEPLAWESARQCLESGKAEFSAPW